MGLWSRIKDWFSGSDKEAADVSSYTYVAPRLDAEAESKQRNFDYAVAATVDIKGKRHEFRDKGVVPSERHLHRADKVVIAMRPPNTNTLNYVTLYGPFEDYDDLDLAIDELLEQEY